jgi:hypothetical protein
MRKNFAAWALDPADFFALAGRDEKLAFLLKFAVLAPSSHNSQPWRFRLGESHVDVLPAAERALPATDLRNNQLYISLGCTIESLVTAADAYGLGTDVSYERDPRGEKDLEAFARVRVSFPLVTRDEIPEGHRVFGIPKRATNRAPHTTVPLPEAMLGAIRAESRGPVEARLVADEAKRNGVAELVLEGGRIAMSDAGFRRELAAYLIPNNSKSPVGMTGATVGMGLVASWLVPKLLARLNPRQKDRPEEVKLLKAQTSSFVVVSSREHEPPGWMEAGRAYMRLALEAERLGLTTNNLAAPVTPASVRAKLAALVGTTFTPQLCFRLGYAAKEMPHCPRLTAEEVTERTSGVRMTASQSGRTQLGA